MELFIAFVVGCFLGSKVTSIWDRIVFKDLLKDLGVTSQRLAQLAREHGIEPEDAESELTHIDIKIEQAGDQLYAYRVDNDQFLGQGCDREQLIARLKETMTGVRLIVSKEHGGDLVKPTE
jgi:hypothetical protein